MGGAASQRGRHGFRVSALLIFFFKLEFLNKELCHFCGWNFIGVFLVQSLSNHKKL